MHVFATLNRRGTGTEKQQQESPRGPEEQEPGKASNGKKHAKQASSILTRSLYTWVCNSTGQTSFQRKAIRWGQTAVLICLLFLVLGVLLDSFFPIQKRYIIHRVDRVVDNLYALSLDAYDRNRNYSVPDPWIYSSMPNMVSQDVQMVSRFMPFLQRNPFKFYKELGFSVYPNPDGRSPLLVENYYGHIVILGATNFLGYHVLDLLGRKLPRAEFSERVIAYDQFLPGDPGLPTKRYRQEKLFNDHNIDINEIEMCNELTLSEEVKKYNLSAVIISWFNLNHGKECVYALSKLVLGTMRDVPKFIDISPIPSGDEAEKLAGRFHEMLGYLIHTNKEQYNFRKLTLLDPTMVLFGPGDSSSSLLRRLNRVIFSQSTLSPEDLKRHGIDGDVVLIPVRSLALSLFNQLVGSRHLDNEAPVFRESIAYNAHINDVVATVALCDSSDISSISCWKWPTHLSPTLMDELSIYRRWAREQAYPKGIVLTTYFAGTRWTHRRSRLSSRGDSSHLRRFRRTAHLFNLKVYVWHNGLATNFIEREQTELFRFVHVDVLGTTAPNDPVSIPASPNDIRFVYHNRFLHLLNSTLPETLRPTYLLFTDLLDVHFHGNPWTLMNANNPNSIFIGSEEEPLAGNQVLLDRAQFCGFTEDDMDIFRNPVYQKTLSAGILGGKFYLVQNFLGKVLKLFDRVNSHGNCNMVLFNLVGNLDFPNNLIFGRPFHSRFNAYETEAMTKNVYLVHK